jgi:hypothetical protein
MPVTFVVQTKEGSVGFTQEDIACLLNEAFLVPNRWWKVEIGTRPSEWTHGKESWIETIPVNADGTLLITDIWDEPYSSPYVLNSQDLQTGLQYLYDNAREEYSRFCNGAEDARTADLFLQLCTMGYEKYPYKR